MSFFNQYPNNLLYYIFSLSYYKKLITKYKNLENNKIVKN